MTSKRSIQLAKRVEAWQSHLGPLGLTQYTIDKVSTVDEPGGNPDSAACVTPSQNYDRCRFEFQNDMVDEAYESGDLAYLDQTILHEWLHVAFQRFENAIEMPHDYLAPMVSEIWEEALRQAREQLIDRLARQLYAAYQEEVVS